MYLFVSVLKECYSGFWFLVIYIKGVRILFWDVYYRLKLGKYKDELEMWEKFKCKEGNRVFYIFNLLVNGKRWSLIVYGWCWGEIGDKVWSVYSNIILKLWE